MLRILIADDHEVARRGSVPMPLARRRVDGVAGPNLDDVPAARLREADALHDVQRLAHGMGVPRVSGARGEVHEARPEPGRRLAAGD